MELPLLCETRTIESRMSWPRNNCLILGAGRSGTSLTALLLERAGYHVYRTAVPPDEGNPLGYFEDTEVIAANEAILKSTYRSAQQRLRRAIRRKPDISSTGAWLLDLDYRRLKDISLKPALVQKFQGLFSHVPFAYKDPRFSFTLGAIKSLIPVNTVYICVFRDPLQVVKSTKKHALGSGIVLDDRYCFGLWDAHYRCILEHHRQIAGQWLFISYQSLIDGEGVGVNKLSRFLDVQLDYELVKQELSRSSGEGIVPQYVSELHEQLKALEMIQVESQPLERA
jgi:hypothetical protein